MTEYVPARRYFHEDDPLRQTAAATSLDWFASQVDALLRNKRWYTGHTLRHTNGGAVRELPTRFRRMYCIDPRYEVEGRVDAFVRSDLRSAPVPIRVNDVEICGELRIDIREAEIYKRAWLGRRGSMDSRRVTVDIDYPASTYRVPALESEGISIRSQLAIMPYGNPSHSMSFVYQNDVLQSIRIAAGKNLLAEAREQDDFTNLAFEVGVLAMYMESAASRQLPDRYS